MLGPDRGTASGAWLAVSYIPAMDETGTGRPQTALSHALRIQEQESIEEYDYGVGVEFEHRSGGPAFVQWTRAADGGLTYVEVCFPRSAEEVGGAFGARGFELSTNPDLAALNIWSYESDTPLQMARAESEVLGVLQELVNDLQPAPAAEFSAYPE